MTSFKMGDQSIPGQDEDIFLGTTTTNLKSMIFLSIYPFCSITGTNIIFFVVGYFFTFLGFVRAEIPFAHLDAEPLRWFLVFYLIFFIFIFCSRPLLCFWLVNVIFFWFYFGRIAPL